MADAALAVVMRSQPWMLSAISVLLLTSVVLRAEPKRICIAPDDHTDFFWTDKDDRYCQAVLATLDLYIARADADIAAGKPLEQQSRWV